MFDYKKTHNHYEVWKVMYHGEGTEAENYGFRRHWKMVDKIISDQENLVNDSVIENLTEYGYAIVSSEYSEETNHRVIVAKLGKEDPETFVISPAGKEYNKLDWEEDIAPNIETRTIGTSKTKKKDEKTKREVK